MKGHLSWKRLNSRTAGPVGWPHHRREDRLDHELENVMPAGEVEEVALQLPLNQGTRPGVATRVGGGGVKGHPHDPVSDAPLLQRLHDGLRFIRPCSTGKLRHLQQLNLPSPRHEDGQAVDVGVAGEIRHQLPVPVDYQGAFYSQLLLEGGGQLLAVTTALALDRCPVDVVLNCVVPQGTRCLGEDEHCATVAHLDAIQRGRHVRGDDVEVRSRPFGWDWGDTTCGASFGAGARGG